ncbi:SprT-like domain-containing protein [Acidocella aminolytica]|nr:SprT-like domain-containing protein [Acidocella aminolytica]
MTMTDNPTRQVYVGFSEAYEHFNQVLFEGRLPGCIITMQRHKGALGYFAGDRFGEIAGDGKTDEIALNPVHFKGRTAEETLSTLVHEMTHLEQHHFGSPSRGGYHNAEWAKLMKRVGLQPTDTGRAGGKETGPSMTHLIVEGGPFESACRALLGKGFEIRYSDRWGDVDNDGSRSRAPSRPAGNGDDEGQGEGEAPAPRKKTANKTKFTCPDCGANAWGKPSLNLLCGDCSVRFVSEDGE